MESILVSFQPLERGAGPPAVKSIPESFQLPLTDSGTGNGEIHSGIVPAAREEERVIGSGEIYSNIVSCTHAVFSRTKRVIDSDGIDSRIDSTSSKHIKNWNR